MPVTGQRVVRRTLGRRLTRLRVATGKSRREVAEARLVISDWFKLYVGLEASATRISSYDGEVVPGELQTEQYCRAVFAAEQPPDPEAADRHVKLRMQRQQTLFGRRPAPQLVTVLSEAVLTRPVGGEAVLKAQIEHLRRMAQHDNVQIKVLPWSVGAHAAMAGPFRILDFDDPEDPDVVG